MASLVADYGTSSGNDSESDDYVPSEDKTSAHDSEKTSCNFLMAGNLEDDSSEDENGSETKSLSSKAPGHRLPNPLAAGMRSGLPYEPLASPRNARVTHSVFVNQFQEEEKAKSSILEQHVKMTTKTLLKTIDGKKVCWNFRKGQCRKGHKCMFAHDNDIPLAKPEEAPVTSDNTDHNEGYSHVEQEVDNDAFGEELKKKKRKPGMGPGLVPPKKAMRVLDQQRAKERPWTVKD